MGDIEWRVLIVVLFKLKLLRGINIQELKLCALEPIGANLALKSEVSITQGWEG